MNHLKNEDKLEDLIMSLNPVVCIPTRNAGPQFVKLLEMLKAQKLSFKLVVIDSGSTDRTATLAREAGALVKIIPPEEFNHGSTRKLACELAQAEFYIFMTQDAIPANQYTFVNLLKPFFEYREVGLTYARQLPRQGAGPVEAFSRFFAYPNSSQIKKKSDIPLLGIHTVVCSDACAAFRQEALEAVGGFPENLILGEDIYVASKMVEKGYAIYYQADAQVYHSHDYSIFQEFKRYFDIGVFYESREPWIINTYGSTGAQGRRFFLEGLRYLKNDPRKYLYVTWLLRIFSKLCGYKLGAIERYLPIFLKMKISMQKNFWTTNYLIR